MDQPEVVLSVEEHEMENVDGSVSVVKVTRSGHAPGVECVFEDGRCSCGRLDLGVV